MKPRRIWKTLWTPWTGISPETTTGKLPAIALKQGIRTRIQQHVRRGAVGRLSTQGTLQRKGELSKFRRTGYRPAHTEKKPTGVPKRLLEHHHLHRPKLPAGIAAGIISRLCAKRDPVPTMSERGSTPSGECYSAYAGPKGEPVRPNLYQADPSPAPTAACCSWPLCYLHPGKSLCHDPGFQVPFWGTAYDLSREVTAKLQNLRGCLRQRLR